MLRTILVAAALSSALLVGSAAPLARNLPECRMPISVPDLASSERMPGSHAPRMAGTEAFGCTNPLGPRLSPRTARTR